MEGAETLFGFGDELVIVLEGTEAHGVVDVTDDDTMPSERLAQENVFIAVVMEPLIKGMSQHDVAADQKVGSVEVLVG